MVNTRYIHFRVTREQYEAIKSNAIAAGKKNVSDYLRDIALKEAPTILRQLDKLEGDIRKTIDLSKEILNGLAK